MAIFHLNQRIGKRSGGKNSVFASAYFRGEKRYCERTEETKDFSDKSDVVYKACLLPDGAPVWAAKLSQAQVQTSDGAFVFDVAGNVLSNDLWNKIEFAEKRKDAQLYWHTDVALPNALSLEQAKTLVLRYASDFMAQDGLFCDVAIHWDEGNHHVHLMQPLRQLTDEGFSTKKIRLSKAALSERVQVLREGWATGCNVALKEAGLDERVDHRSYKERGIDLMPTIKVGKSTHMHGSEQQEIRLASNAAIRQKNLAAIQADPGILAKKLGQESEVVTIDKAQSSVADYVVNAERLKKLGEKLPVDASLEKARKEIIADIQKTQGVFTAKTVKAKVLSQAGNVAQFDQLVSRILGSAELIPLGLGEDGREHYTTEAAFKLELQLAKSVQQLGRRVVKGVSPLKITRLAHAMTLNPGQARALAHIHNDSAISIVVGYAGTGKTYLLKAANVLWAKNKRNVFGIALSGAAAASLEKESEISSSTIASFLCGLKTGRITLNNHSVVVMDEMGMTPLDDMHAVMDAVNLAGAEFVGLGDGEQTQPIGRTGAPLRAIIEKTGCVTLDEVMRQQVSWQRNATVLMETQRTRVALDVYQSRDCVQLVSENVVSQSVVDAWFQHVEAARKKEAAWVSALQSSIMIAHQNENVKILNDLARKALQEKGALRTTHRFISAFGALDVGLGERLLFKQNDKRLGVKNGHFGTLLSIDEQGKLTVKCDTGKIVSFSSRDYSAIDYGYAATVHKLQGFTGDHSIVHVDGHGWNRHLFLVAASRHRHSLSLFAGDETFRDYDHLRESVSRHGLSDHVLEFPATFALRRGLEPESVVNRAVRAVRRASSTVYDAWLYLYNFQGYLDRAVEKTTRASESPEALQRKRREAAVKVADFADNRVAIAQAIGSLPSLSLDEKGRVQSSIYALQKRNGLIAVDVLSHPEQHAIAIERNRLPAGSFNKALNFIDQDQAIEAAIVSFRLKQFSDGVLADKVMTHIKAYWGHLLHHLPDKKVRDEFIDVLRPLATQHQFNEAMKQLETEEEKHCLITVKRYCDLDAEASQQLRGLKGLGEEQKKAAQAVLSAITYERGSLADKVCSDYAPYRFGREALHCDEKRLQGHQRRFHDRQTVWTFATMPPSTSHKPNLKKMLLSSRIKAEPKRYGSLVFEQLIDGYKSVNIENWRGERYRTLHDPKAPYAFRYNVREIKKYLSACRATSDAWKIAYHKRDKQSPKFKDAIKCAQGLSVTRDRFASKIVNDFDHYALAVDYERIDLTRLSQQARQFDYMGRYRNETHPIRLLRRAHHISANFKAFGGAVATHGLYFKIREQAHHFHYLHVLKKEPNAAVRKAIRWGERYRAKRIDAGMAWGLVKSAHTQAKANLTLEAKQLMYQRNRAAYRFVQACYGQGIESIDESGIKIDFDAVNKAAKQHIAYKRVLAYLKAETPVQGALANGILADRSGFHFVYDNGIDFKLLNTQSHAWLAGQPIPGVLPSKTTAVKPAAQQYPRWDIERINSALMANPEMTYQTIIGDYKKRGSELRFGNGLCVTATGSKAGLWYSFTESIGGTPLHAIQHFHGKSLPEALEYGASLAGLSDAEAKTASDRIIIKKPASTQQENEWNALRIKAAQSLWHKTEAVEFDDPVDCYMSEHRNVYSTSGLAIRILPVGATWTDYTETGDAVKKVNKLPLMVVAAKDTNGNVTGVQRTFLDKQTYNKAAFMDNAKLSKGIIKGSAVTLQSGTNGKVYIAEGVETGASLALADRSATVLVSLSVANMKALLSIVQALSPDEVIIAQDNDGENAVSDKTITDVLKHYENSGLSVSTIKPGMLPGKTKTDWNDVIQAKGVNAIRTESGIPVPEYERNTQKVLDELIKPNLPDRNSMDDISYDAIKDYFKYRLKAALFLTKNENIKKESTDRLKALYVYDLRYHARHMTQDTITNEWVNKLGIAKIVYHDSSRYTRIALDVVFDNIDKRDEYARLKTGESMLNIRSGRALGECKSQSAKFNNMFGVKKGKAQKY